MNISVSFTIFGPTSRSHLPAEEENHPNQEGAAHNQWRSQCCQILEHAGLLSPPEFALLVSLPGIVTYPLRPPRTRASPRGHGLISRICAMIMSVVPSFP